MREYWNELVLYFFLALGIVFIGIAVKGFLKVTLPKLPVPDGLAEAFAG